MRVALSWLRGGLALGAVNALAFAGCGSDGTSALGACRTWCERLVASGCEPDGTPTDARDCPALCATTVDSECAVELQAVRRCAASAPFECVPGTCETGSDLCTDDRVELQGCEQQELAYADCYRACSNLDGTGRFVSEDGTEGVFSYESGCGECPPTASMGGEPGAPCTDLETDCAPICCACDSFHVSVYACLGGVCAEEAVACGPEIDACGEL